MFILCDGPDGYVHEYSLNNLDYLALMKSLPLYGQLIADPLVYDYSWDTQLLYLLVHKIT